MHDGRCKIRESLMLLQKIVETVPPTLLFVCPLVFAAPHAYLKRAVPATGDMNNPSHSSERVKKCMLDLDSRPGACHASPEAKLILGWTALMLGLPECEMFMVWTLLGQPVQQVR